MKKGYVYTGRVDSEMLKELVQNLNNKILLSWDLSQLDFSEDLRDAGCAFDSKAEIRWQRVGDIFRVLVLSDDERPDIGFKLVQGDWRIQDGKTTTISMNDHHFSPQFEKYPTVDTASARLNYKVFYRNHVAMFVSPREVIDDEAQTS